MGSPILISFYFLCIFCFCKTQLISQGKTVLNDTYANAGNFQGISNIANEIVIQNNLASNNTATSRNGLANAGDRTFFYGGDNGAIDNSTFRITNTALDNIATSRQYSSISGTQLVVNQINKSNFEEVGTTSNNTALVRGRRGTEDTSAISGSQSQIINVKNSDVSIAGTATSNQAIDNLPGNSLSGTEQSLGNVVRSKVQLDSETSNNNARTAEGQAIAGSLNGIGQAIFSRVNMSSNAYQNTAYSGGGNAVSGVQNNIQLLVGTFNGNSGQKPTLTVSDTASDNVALADSYGKAVSGIQTNIRDAINSYLRLSANSTNNEAIVDGIGEYGPKDAVAGVDVTLGNLHDSKINLTIVSDGNSARNYHEDPYYKSDAVAGTQLTIGNTDNVVFFAEVNSTNNNAYAVFGDAIGGNKITFYDYNNTLSGTINKIAKNNTAESVYGDAIVESHVVVKNQVVYP
eukprot:TRINITY_DN2495_c0_g1_i1.p1 TRINITY_DN2495_c0_g1~~TRINITY_DN2495_c0_g1_i1.p1  ORF type:complete len:487 (+),score=51.54 TRINITY_DN2495_c0_g1_i1:82-1461(+)